ncbi:MAG: mycofactocin system FadH/OYE family oxidoreductase 1 [Pseudonocardia sp.]|nr:mycofactocin system FadH/OYE family oxidoreductase 1 [Pseudonocardia sp.]
MPDHDLASGRLTGPVEIRGRRAASRVLFGPHETNLGYRREISDSHVAYYARRAVGGAGVIVTEVASVHPSDHPYERAPLAADCRPGWAAVAAACRPHGPLVLAGLGHAGGQGSTAYSQLPLWGPSRVPDVVTREVPMVMEQPEIGALVDGFAAAATGAAAAGLDGVEINAGQHSLLRQFCSGLTNHRTDGYGAERGLLLREVLAVVRDALGPDRVLGLRLCVDELAPWAGITPEAGARLAVTVADAVDYLVPVRGSALSVSATRPDLHTTPGFLRETCATVRTAVRSRPGPGSQPVASPPLLVLQGSVVDPGTADAALSEGTADLVEMTRALISDPDLVRLIRAGTPERIRPCTLSNQRSLARDPRNPIVGDEAEPRSGHETTDPPVEGRDPVPREVLVVGGGPAGLEAARTLALRGHRARLHERERVLGGALRFAAAVHGRERIGVLLPWWERELGRLGVQVRTGVEVTAEDLDAAERTGAVVLLATGSRPPTPPALDIPVIAAAEFERTVLRTGSTSAAVAERIASVRPAAGPAATAPAAAPLTAPVAAGSVGARSVGAGPAAVVVLDPVGDWTGAGIAEQLAAAGVGCTLVTPDAVAGDQLGRTGDLAGANTRLERAGVTRALFCTLGTVTDGRALLADVHTGATREVPCDLVVDCSARLPEEALSGETLPETTLPGETPRPAGRYRLRAGDCVAPRTVAEAVREGRRAAMAIGAARPATVPGGAPR